jgi:hypothetical protein
LPFSTWSLTKLAEFLVAEGVVDDISHEGLRDLLRKLPRPGRQWAPVASKQDKDATASPRRRHRRGTYTRTQGVRHLFAALWTSAPTRCTAMSR